MTHESSRSALPLRTARPIWQDARKTSRRAQRLRGSLPSGCHGRPRPALPETRTRLAFAVSRAADSPQAICDGSNRTQVPGDITCTSPHAKHRRYGALRSRLRRSRAATALPPKFSPKAPKDQAADRTDRREPQLDRSVRRASDDYWNVFLYRVLCDSMYHPDGT